MLVPQSPMRPVFQTYPPGLSGPVPSPTIVASTRKKGLRAAIRRFLRFASVSQSPKAEVTLPSIPPVWQDWVLDTDTPRLSKVEPYEWKQYGYWARPFLNDVECPNSPREALVPRPSKISSFPSNQIPTITIHTQNYGFQASNTVLSHLVLLVGHSPFLANLYHSLGKFSSTPCCST